MREMQRLLQLLDQGKIEDSPHARVMAMLRSGLKAEQIVNEAGVTNPELGGWLSGEGEGESERVNKRIVTWLSRQVSEGDGLPWVQTEVTRSIWGLLEQCRQESKTGVVVTAPGLGKTTTALTYAALHLSAGKSFYISANSFTSTTSGVLHKVAQAVLGSGYAQFDRVDRGAVLANRIMDKLRRGNLLIVDEAQALDDVALNALRAFPDETWCGLVLLGNEYVFNRIIKGSQAQFAQLHSRIGARVHFPVAPSEDIDEILQAWDVHGAAERELLQGIARGPGGIRQMANVMRQSRAAARSISRPLDAQLLHAVASSLGITD